MRLLQLQLVSSLALAAVTVGCSDTTGSDGDSSTPATGFDAGSLPGADGSVVSGFDGSIFTYDSSIVSPGYDASTDGSISAGDAGTATDAGDAGPAPTGSCSGKPGKLRGKSRGTVMVGGMMRTFVYYAPMNADASKAMPLIISPHGFTMSGEDMYGLTGYKEVADREGAIAIFPDGEGATPWNVGSNICGVGAAVGASGNDQGFIDELIKFADADQCIDKKHMFVSGFSMGGYFSNENGCLRSDLASIGPHSGGTHDLAACPGSKKPVIIFHGDADPLIGYDCGTGARDRWVARNGCSKDVDKKTVKGGTCEYHKGCPANAQVVLCHFDGMGHAWAGGKGSSAFIDTSKENAADLAWAFWKQYAW